MDAFSEAWNYLLGAHVWGISVPVFVWLVGSYALSVGLWIQSKKFDTFMILGAPVFWPVVVVALAAGLVMLDVGNGLARMYSRPLEYLMFATLQISVVIPRMPKQLLAFGSRESSSLYWSHFWQYLVVVIFGVSLVLYHWSRPKYTQQTTNMMSRERFFAIISVILLAVCSVFLTGLLISQAYVSVWSFLMIAGSVWVSMIIDEFTKEHPQASEIFRGSLSVLRGIRMMRR